MVFQKFLEDSVIQKIEEQNANILKSLNLEDPNTVQLNNKKFQLFLKKREIDFLLEYFFAKHLNKMAHRFGKEVISSNLIFMPILKGGVYLEDKIKNFSRLHFVSSEFIGVRSYSGTQKKENDFYLKCNKKEIENKHLILIDEIVDSGETLQIVIEELSAKKPASINFFIAINKLASGKKNSLKKIFEQYGIYTSAINCPHDYWAMGTLLGLDSNQFCRATLDHLYIEKKKEPIDRSVVSFYVKLEKLITEYKEKKITKEVVAQVIDDYEAKNL